MQGASYPDLVEHDGRYFITATQKTTARVKEVPATWMEALWSQPHRSEVARDGLVASHGAGRLASDHEIEMPALPDLSTGGGFVIDLRFRMTYAEPGQILFDSTAADGPGIRIRTRWHHKLEISLSDGQRSFAWSTDPAPVTLDTPHNVTFIVDGGPKLLSAVMDGRLCDRGASDSRRYGYGRFHQTKFLSREQSEPRTEIGNVTGSPRLRVLPEVHEGTVIERLRIYNRPIMTTEAVGNWRADSGDSPNG